MFDQNTISCISNVDWYLPSPSKGIVKNSINRSMNQWMNEWPNQSINQSINQSTAINNSIYAFVFITLRCTCTQYLSFYPLPSTGCSILLSCVNDVLHLVSNTVQGEPGQCIVVVATHLTKNTLEIIPDEMEEGGGEEGKNDWEERGENREGEGKTKKNGKHRERIKWRE